LSSTRASGQTHIGDHSHRLCCQAKKSTLCDLCKLSAYYVTYAYYVNYAIQTLNSFTTQGYVSQRSSLLPHNKGVLLDTLGDTPLESMATCSTQYPASSAPQAHRAGGMWTCPSSSRAAVLGTREPLEGSTRPWSPRGLHSPPLHTSLLHHPQNTPTIFIHQANPGKS